MLMQQGARTSQVLQQTNDVCVCVPLGEAGAGRGRGRCLGRVCAVCSARRPCRPLPLGEAGTGRGRVHCMGVCVCVCVCVEATADQVLELLKVPVARTTGV